MRPLSSLERLLERAFERPSARLFRTPLSVVVIERRIERAMEVERRRVDGRTAVPDLFAVAIRRRDLEALSAAAGGEDRLVARLADAALAFARGHDYAPARVPVVSLVIDPTVPVGDVRVAATYSAAPGRVGDGADGPVRDASRARSGHSRQGGGEPTLVLPTPAPAGPPLAVLVVREPGGRVRQLPLDGSPVVVGRDAACDVVLDDRRASRRHARIGARGGYLVLSDLGSTNGTYIRSERISEVTLGLGDAVVIGDSTLEIVQSTRDAPAASPSEDPPASPMGR